MTICFHAKTIDGCRCMWQGTECKPEYFSSVLTEMGRCFTFNGNSDDVLFAEKTGNVIKCTYYTSQ